MVDTMEFVVEKAEMGDRDVIVESIMNMALESEGMVLEHRTVVSAMDRLLRDPSRGFYLLVRCEGRVLGQCMITSEFSDWKDGVYWWVQSVTSTHRTGARVFSGRSSSIFGDWRRNKGTFSASGSMSTGITRTPSRPTGA